MTADKIIDAVKKALGDPASGPVADALPIIEAAINGAMATDTPQGDGAKPATRVVKAAETR